MALKERMNALIGEFADKLVGLMQDQLFQSMASLGQAEAPVRRRRGRPAGSKSVKKPVRRGRRPGRPKKVKAAPTKAARKTVRKKRHNYPKCAYPGCNMNRFPRGGGYCGIHWRLFKAGEIAPAKV